MSHLVQHAAAGEGAELTAPDAGPHSEDRRGTHRRSVRAFRGRRAEGAGNAAAPDRWAKAYYVLHGRMIVEVEAEGFDLEPGSSITIPPGAVHTFTVLSPTAKLLVVSLTGAMGRFHADLHATVPHGRPIEEVAQEIQQVLGRHDVTMAGLMAAR